MENYFMLDGVKTKMSDETAESLRKKRDEPKMIAAISDEGDDVKLTRLILCLDDEILATKYKGLVLSLHSNGRVICTVGKRYYNIKTRPHYSGDAHEKQIFPIIR